MNIFDGKSDKLNFFQKIDGQTVRIKKLTKELSKVSSLRKIFPPPIQTLFIFISYSRVISGKKRKETANKQAEVNEEETLCIMYAGSYSVPGEEMDEMSYL